MKKWNEETIKEEALKHQTKTAFNQKARGAYHAAKKLGILDDVCSHMKRTISPKKKWDESTLRNEALKYSYKTEFQRKSNGAYQVARKLGLLNKICSHMTRPQRSDVKWDELNIKKEALKYSNKSDFKRKSPGAYNSARDKGMLDSVCGHMTRPTKWTEKKVREEALKYSTKEAFQKLSKGAYKAAIRLEIMDSVRSHMATDRRWKWNKQTIIEEALKYSTRIEFQRKSNAAYQSARRQRILDEVCCHMKPLLRTRKWTEKTIKEAALTCSSRSEFAEKFGGAYQSAGRQRILDEVCSHMKPIPRAVKQEKLRRHIKPFRRNGNKWDEQTIREEAAKYRHVSDFQTASSGAYCAAKKLGIVTSVTAHMTPKKTYWVERAIKEESSDSPLCSDAPETTKISKTMDGIHGFLKIGRPRKWTEKNIKEEALKYSTRTEFFKQSSGAYQQARKQGMLDDVCSHMSAPYSIIKK